ncbi:hypothetical protein ASPWEDRAFT_171396 [Aspergillus wentii DTO 134E9]|uniref:MARVEL domain-containing protein n=1 Tax=Aspergillus wentii DTO 134E9 TaxID=1073089 RepID=A0A1L9RSS5_ASPWE|nr:uncharacterized protein ASPWEDRAFT_171396 [Aspergillus wentii DTO 134E9]KAI9930771.1 hypothetical protein MW887_011528 [Aspergillus wentii]OJJ37944.1 hypothetical protein ASPWEDRAFT_171396 [Aspergillus wentii DTO 134E9]
MTINDIQGLRTRGNCLAFRCQVTILHIVAISILCVGTSASYFMDIILAVFAIWSIIDQMLLIFEHRLHPRWSIGFDLLSMVACVLAGCWSIIFLTDMSDGLVISRQFEFRLKFGGTLLLIAGVFYFVIFVRSCSSLHQQRKDAKRTAWEAFALHG